MGIYKDEFTALALAICERDQEKKCQSSQQQFIENMKTIIKFFSTTGFTLAESFVNVIKGSIVGAENNAEGAKGNPISKLVHVVRGAVDAFPKQSSKTTSDYMKRILTNNKC